MMKEFYIYAKLWENFIFTYLPNLLVPPTLLSQTSIYSHRGDLLKDKCEGPLILRPLWQLQPRLAYSSKMIVKILWVSVPNLYVFLSFNPDTLTLVFISRKKNSFSDTPSVNPDT